MNWIPLEDRVLIRQDEAKKEKSGILIPEASQVKPPTGTIVKIGPGKPRGQESPIGYSVNDVFFSDIEGMHIDDKDRVVPIYSTLLKENDKIMYARHAGVEIEVNGETLLVMRFSDIICRV